MPDRFGYPAPRARGAWPARTPLEGFIALESTRGLVVLGDAEADVIRFSGAVQRVEVRTVTQDAVIRLTDRNDEERDTIRLLADSTRTIDLTCSVVRARNAVAGLISSLDVVGYYQQPGHVNLEPPEVVKVYPDTPSG